MIDTLVFAVAVPFTARDYQRFGIELLSARGFRIQVWDLSTILHAGIIHQVQVPDRKQWEGCMRFSTKDEARNAIRQLPRTSMVLCFLGYSRETFFFFRSLSSRHIPYGVMVSNTIPQPAGSGAGSLPERCIALSQKIMGTPAKTSVFHVLNRILLRGYPFFGIRPASICILGGSRSADVIPYPVGQSTRYVWTHALDYDLYLSMKDRPVQADRSLGVFLDEYLPFHPDLVLTGNEPHCPPEEYYPQLRSFFDRLEAEYGVHITVAAHPRSQYELHPDYFGGRPVVRGGTPSLVQEAGFVVLHGSTALNFAVLFEKPVIFVTSRRIDADPGTCRLGSVLRAMTVILGKRPVFLDEPYSLDWTREMAVDREAYARYRDRYIKKDGTEDRNTWDIVADAIIQGFGE